MLVIYTSDREHNPGAPADHVGEIPNLRWQTKSKTNPARKSGVCLIDAVFSYLSATFTVGNYI